MMTTSEKIAYVQAMVDDPEATDALVTALLLKARTAVMNRRYPHGTPEGVLDVPGGVALNTQFCMSNADARGTGDGERVHNENGINRTYGSVNDEDILMEVMQEIRL